MKENKPVTRSTTREVMLPVVRTVAMERRFGMKLFTRVAIICDHTLLDEALALRRVLESFTLHVDFYQLVQARHVVEFFAAPPAGCDAVIIVVHGDGEDSAPYLRFDVIDQETADYQSPTGWHPTILEWTPERIRTQVGKGLGTVISLACGGGRAPLAEAFLDAGCDAYIGAVERYIDMHSAMMFAISFFYWLLAEDRDYCPTRCSASQAADRAKNFDQGWDYGTESFRFYTRTPSPAG